MFSFLESAKLQSHTKSQILSGQSPIMYSERLLGSPTLTEALPFSLSSDEGQNDNF